MCGIAGWLFTPGNEPQADALDRMAETIRHRGPDDQGFYREPVSGLALAHRRLSIIDLSDASHQPMLDVTRQLALVYNGELYNFRDLRRKLQGLGHVFRSSGDTEVVLRSFIEWGVVAFERFNGMFALALWDGASRTLHLARDAMGIKPLYYLPRSDGLFFASELKAFSALPDFRAQLDGRSLNQYLEFGYVFDEQATLLAGVKKLAPGHRLEVRDGRVAADVAFFVPPAPDRADTRSESDRLDELGAVLEQVVDEHLIADVPVGLLLSGGLDSSVLAALAAKRGELLTICMGFGDSVVDERVHARQVAEHIGSRHVDVLISPQQIKQEVMAGAWVFDDLFADWGTLSTRLLYRRCREMGIKAVLVGEGADELFGGYDCFNLPGKLGLWQQFRLYQKYAGRRHGRFFGDFRRIMGNYLEESGGDAFHAVRLFESRRQLPNQYVMKVDKASMAESVEARTPYLDRRVAELAYRTPKEWLMRQGNNGHGENKYLLRALARRHGLIPEAISGRKKFGAPLAASWMDEDAAFREFARNILLDAGSITYRLGLDRAMRAYFDEGRSGYAFPRALSIFRNLAWRLLLLELWSQHYEYGRAIKDSNEMSGPSPEVVSISPAVVIPMLISTIIPVHNRSDLLREAVNSVLAQDYRPIEIIIVDDGSTDDTPAVADELQMQHADIIRVIHQANAGPGPARQAGFEASRGEFIQYLDSDDLLLPGKFSLQVRGLSNDAEAGISYGPTLERDEKTGVTEVTHGTDVKQRDIFPAVLKSRLWATLTPLYRRSVCEAVGQWSSKRIFEDWDYDCRAGLLGIKLHYCGESIALVRRNIGDHAGLAWQRNASAMQARINAYVSVFNYAQQAGIAKESNEMQHFVRSLFWMAREAGAYGFSGESQELFRLASEHTAKQGWDFRLYGMATRVLGWRGAGRLAAVIDRWWK